MNVKELILDKMCESLEKTVIAMIHKMALGEDRDISNPDFIAWRDESVKKDMIRIRENCGHLLSVIFSEEELNIFKDLLEKNIGEGLLEKRKVIEFNSNLVLVFVAVTDKYNFIPEF